MRGKRDRDGEACFAKFVRKIEEDAEVDLYELLGVDEEATTQQVLSFSLTFIFGETKITTTTKRIKTIRFDPHTESLVSSTTRTSVAQRNVPKCSTRFGMQMRFLLLPALFFHIFGEKNGRVIKVYSPRGCTDFSFPNGLQ